MHGWKEGRKRSQQLARIDGQRNKKKGDKIFANDYYPLSESESVEVVSFRRAADPLFDPAFSVHAHSLCGVEICLVKGNE
jgi:hypothetical protein